MGFVVRVLILVSLHVARLIRQILATGYTLAFPGLVESLLVRARVFTHVRQPVDRRRRFSCSSGRACDARWATVRHLLLHLRQVDFLTFGKLLQERFILFDPQLHRLVLFEVDPGVGGRDLLPVDHLRLLHPFVALAKGDQLPVALWIAEFRESFEISEKASRLRRPGAARC